MRNFFYMGGYAFYVWGSYIAALILIVAELVSIRKRHSGLR
jgi:heme exporter protein CcmD